tara:strand:- start:929 stop:2467 length:1539 start_codon:yes stop_codon:yes gene_type:complete
MNFADYVLRGGSADDQDPGLLDLGSNAKINPTLVAGVVIEVFNDLSSLPAEYLENLHNRCKNQEFINSAPRNSIVVQLVSAGKGISESSLFLCYPFFPPHLCMPLNPGEMVWLIDPFPGEESDLMYWMCRITGPNYVDDINFTHFDRALLDSSDVMEDTPSVPGFPNGADSKSNWTLTPLHAYQEIYTGSLGNKAIAFESVPRFTKRPGDLVLQGSNNAMICLGMDRGYTKDFSPKTDKANDAGTGNISNAFKDTKGETPAGNWVEDISPVADLPDDTGYGRNLDENPFQPREPYNRGTIDLVVGRGQVDGTKQLETNNAWEFKETNKNPVNFGNVPNAQEDPISNRLINPAEGDPDFTSDLSRIYVSMKTSGDTNFGLTYVNADATTVDDAPYVILKSDEARIIAREGGSIRLVKEGENKCEINMLSNGKIAMDAGKIYLGENSAGVESQPVLHGQAVVDAFEVYVGELHNALYTNTFGNLGAPVVGTIESINTTLVDALKAALSTTTYTK